MVFLEVYIFFIIHSFQFLSKKVDLDGLQLGKTSVGKSKDNLDPATPDLVAADVIHTFGLFVKYFVEQMTPARLVTQGRPICS